MGMIRQIDMYLIITLGYYGYFYEHKMVDKGYTLGRDRMIFYVDG